MMSDGNLRADYRPPSVASGKGVDLPTVFMSRLSCPWADGYPEYPPNTLCNGYSFSATIPRQWPLH